MPFIKQQIEAINKHLLSVALADARFGGGRIEAIAVDVVRTNQDGSKQVFPAVMDRDYEPREITVNDTYPILIYHKLMATRYEPFKTNYGQGLQKQMQTTQVKMVVYGKYSVLSLTRESLEALIITNFPDNLPAADIAPLQLDQVMASVQGSNLNSLQVWQDEYKGFDFPLGAEDILFSTTYTLQSVFQKGCFQICNC